MKITWAHKNNPSDPIWTYSSMSKSGANELARFMKDVIKCELIQLPVLNEHNVWEFKFTNPLL
jgi:hypothetical protein